MVSAARGKCFSFWLDAARSSDGARTQIHNQQLDLTEKWRYRLQPFPARRTLPPTKPIPIIFHLTITMATNDTRLASNDAAQQLTPDPQPMPERFVCIHAHLYQPPRENPWLESVEAQPSAYPFHDWNERITAECYAPNGASRIVDARGRIIEIVNNYARISFNFGPTLLSWMEQNSPEVYGGILEADKLSQQNFSGHGSAIAQAYNHIILPLANRRDKETQIRWGIRDFQSRFGRDPEGMWLAETAIDLESLELMADAGIKFTILAPSQAAAVRELGSTSDFADVTGARIDPSRAYQLNFA